MTDKAKWAALAAFCVLFAGCAGMTAAETTAVVASGSTALLTFVQSLTDSGLIKPEKAAELTAIAGQVQGVVDAAAVAVKTVAQSVADIRAQQDAAQASEWTQGEVTAAAGGVAAAGVAASRALSRMKHGAKESA